MEDTHDKPDAGSEARPHDAQALRIAILGDGPLRLACVDALLKRCDAQIATFDLASAAALRTDSPADVALLPLLCPHAVALSEVSDTVHALANLPLAVLLDRGEAQIVERLVTSGVRGVLTLDLDMKVIAPALRLIAAGGIYLPPQPAGRSASGALPAHAARPGSNEPAAFRMLSPRERAVLDLLQRSLSNREIAAALGIAEATVKIHVRNLLRKTRARNRVELALLAARKSA